MGKHSKGAGTLQERGECDPQVWTLLGSEAFLFPKPGGPGPASSCPSLWWGDGASSLAPDPELQPSLIFLVPTTQSSRRDGARELRSQHQESAPELPASLPTLWNTRPLSDIREGWGWRGEETGVWKREMGMPTAVGL